MDRDYRAGFHAGFNLMAIIALMLMALANCAPEPQAHGGRLERVSCWVGAYMTAEDLKRLAAECTLRAPCVAWSYWHNGDRLPGCVYPLCDSLHCHPPMILKDLTKP